MKNGIIGVAVVALLAAGGTATYFLVNDDNEPETKNNVTTTQVVPEEKTEPTKEANITDQATAKLVAQPNYTGSGTGTRNITDGVYMHEVTANIGDPADGKFYEGWIVGPDGFLSTGKMTKETNGQYSLSYSNENTDLAKTHNKVVITEETEADGLDNKPEAHVIEGDF